MNYLAHALPHLEGGYVVAGTSLPDWLSVVDRGLRIRPKQLDQLPDALPAETLDLVRGVRQHFADDDWFHRTRGFAEVTAQVGLLFRHRLQGSDGFRCGFMGHIVSEMLLDAAIDRRYPAALDRYYAAVSDVDARRIVEFVELVTGRDASRLGELLPLFLRERFLLDYRDNRLFLRRLNQVLKRVTLSQLPQEAADWIEEIRWLVDARVHDLLPAPQFAWPVAPSLTGD